VHGEARVDVEGSSRILRQHQALSVLAGSADLLVSIRSDRATQFVVLAGKRVPRR
jgi:hypothetical protein